MTPDRLLGRDYTFRMNVDNTLQFCIVKVVAWDPTRGVRLSGEGFTSEWVDHFMWRRLLAAGVLEEA